MIKDSLQILKEEGYTPSGILDIGASQGLFSLMCREIWSNVNIKMFEANKNCEHWLKATRIPYEIKLLGKECKSNIPFYMDTNDPTSTGCSIYKENSDVSGCFKEGNYKTELLDIFTLDSLISSDESYDFIKMDVQGAELDIIKGAPNLISKCKYLLLETSLITCNIGAPLQSEILSYLNTQGFTGYYLLEEHYHNGVNIQEDLLFLKE